jgi:hypothetical protein|tara:strand:+ start:273 stop:467 length:195 start_codon:yes stop_codon:yes gene_type:complete
MSRGPKKTPPSIGPLEYKTFDEYWQRENELWEISLKESIRQTKERKVKLDEKNMCKVWDGIRDN